MMTSAEMRPGRIIVAMLGVLLVPAITFAGGKLPMARHLATPPYVTANTRAELDARMGRHAEVMSNLVRAVVLLDRPTVRVLASRIADEEVIAHADKSAPERMPLNLPPEFSGEQTALTAAARELALAAADSGDDQLLAQRFAAVTTTCVGCHSVYLHGHPDPERPGPRPK
jgi:hypothetical protein